mgnify:CR=1 FL=1
MHTKESLQKILTEPKNSLVSQYQNIFLNDNIKLEINNEAIEKIAQISIENNTGARGLKNSMENLLADTMFEYLGNNNIEKVVITKETVSNKKPDVILKAKKQKLKRKQRKASFNRSFFILIYFKTKNKIQTKKEAHKASITNRIFF